MLYYDYMLTFPDELRYIWRLDSLKRVSTLLYICCRFAIPGNLFYLLSVAGAFGDECDTGYRSVAAFSVMTRAAVISE